MCNVTDMELQFSQRDLLEWGVDEVIGKDELEKTLQSGRTLKVKLGIDPTSPNIHLGRSVPLWRLRAFQELGHEIHFIIGDFTGQIGDTSDKESERPMLSRESIQENLKHYLQQVWMILNPDKKDQVFIHYNSEWLSKLTLGELSRLADAFSVNTFIKRELITRRLDAGSRVSLREMLYPLMQGYDSLAVEADVELGGTDQRFNLLAGRTLQEQVGKNPQAIIMGNLIRGTDGRKMSSSWGNVISLLDTPADKFGKIMALRDELLEEYLWTLPSSVVPFTAQHLKEMASSGANPREMKLDFAERLVELYHGANEAKTAREGWISQFSENQLPSDIPAYPLPTGSYKLTDLLFETELVGTKSDARRLIEQGGVQLGGEKVTTVDYQFDLQNRILLQVGKRRFLYLEPRT